NSSHNTRIKASFASGLRLLRSGRFCILLHYDIFLWLQSLAGGVEQLPLNTYGDGSIFDVETPMEITGQ
ncbi:MAG: hypothetical protein AAGI69_28965, partial [Cyanobacteria bacterium P01_H01_bin.21]